MGSWRRELSVAVVLALLLGLVGLQAPEFFQRGNLRDLLIDNALVLLPAIGMTVVILAREIDLSIGSVFAVCGVAAGLLARAEVPLPLLFLIVPLLGGLFGALNGVLVTCVGIPSIIVTLAMMLALRDALNWATQGAWVMGLPADWQWLGLGQDRGQAVLLLLVAAVFATAVWALGHVAAGRAVYAVGADKEAARLAGIRPGAVVLGSFVLLGALTGLAALLHSVRFLGVQPSAGGGLELKVIACVVVGGTSIMGGRGRLIGTLIGAALLGVIGTTLTFMQVEPAWERALQGLIILAAVAWDALARSREGAAWEES